jgi:predicted O-linked N-acetylglucosamine transferase (SPINDLY family)
MQNNINLLLQHAIAHLQQGRFEEAGAIAQQIIAKAPQNGDANLLLGVVASQRGDHDFAEKCMACAIRDNPDQPLYHFNHGIALKNGHRPEQAVLAYERTIQLKPDYAEAYNNLGGVLRDLNRTDEALSAYNGAVQHRPDYGMAYNNRGMTLADLAQFNEALLDFQRATRLMPRFADAYNNCGNVLQKLNRYDEAEDYVRRALSVKPNFAIAHANLAHILNKTGQFQEAEKCLRRALQLSPELAIAHSNLLFLLASTVTLPADVLFEEQRNWDRIHGIEGRTNALPAVLKDPASDRRLRIGYVSPDFRNHAVNYFFEPLLTAHDRSRFEIFCYACHNARESDSTTDHLREIAEHWRFLTGKSDQEAAQLIRDDRIDLLIDLAGHTANNRLKIFTYSPAPVQITYLGYIASTGLEAMDYWITDNVLHPDPTEEKCIETLYRLPRCWVSYKPSDQAPEVAACPNPDDHVLFGFLSCSSKMTESTIETWSNILNALPDSRLLLMDGSLAGDKIRKQVTDRFANYQIPPERLLLRPNASMREYLSTYNEIDIVLDTFPRTGGTTTAEALWMGVPVVTLAGKRYAERISASKLTAVGLEQLIADNREDYVRIAVALARNSAFRIELRAQLRRRMAQSPLCDTESLAREIELAYRAMWEKYCSE